MPLECREAFELVTAAVDGRLDGDALVHLQNHLRQCGRCRNEYELETWTKNMLRRSVPRTAPPDHLVTRIQQGLRADRRPGPGIWRSPSAFLAYAAAAAVVLIFFITSPSSSRHFHTRPADGNVINQTYNNFDAVLDGKITPAIQTADFGAVKSFLVNEASFDVKVPAMTDCALLGGVASQYVGQHLAHVVYRRGDDLVYLFEMPLCCVDQPSPMQLPAAVREELRRTGWYVESHGGKCSLALWVVDSTLCCAIADMDTNDLLACLNERR